MSYKCISVDEAEALLKIEGATLLDIRDEIYQKNDIQIQFCIN